MPENKLELALKDQPKSANIDSGKVMEYLSSDTIIAYRIEHEKNKTCVSVVSILEGNLRRLKIDIYDSGDNTPQIIADNRDRIEGENAKNKLHELLGQNPGILARVEKINWDDINQLLFLYYTLLTNNGFNVINSFEVKV